MRVGTKHWQGYFEFTQAIRLSQIKKVWRKAHFIIPKGTRVQCRRYCMKDETRCGDMHEIGEWCGSLWGLDFNDRPIDAWEFVFAW